MSLAVVLRKDFSAENLRALARVSRDERQRARLLALTAIADGASRAEAAQIGGMDRQTLRDWVHRFNTYGPEGLLDRRSPGRPPKLSDAQKKDLRSLIEGQPSVTTDGVVRLRYCDLARIVKERYDVDYDETTIGRLLRRLGFSHISSQRKPSDDDPSQSVEWVHGDSRKRVSR